MRDASDKPRQFKQTKLRFGAFASASQSQPKKPRLAAEEHNRHEADHKSEPGREHPPEQDQSDKSALNDSNEASETSIEGATHKDSHPTGSAQHAPPPPPHPAIPPAPSPATTTPALLKPAHSRRIRITDQTGDLFSTPPGSLLIHACNALGSWGGGIALAFRNQYPAAFRVYRAHCARSTTTPDRLVGTALLIPPQQQQQQPQQQQQGGGTGEGRKGHYIGCLFTSRRYGKARDPPERILSATGPAMRELMRLVAEEERRTGVRIRDVRMCRINSGLFAVPWARSKAVIEGIELGEGEVPGVAEGGVLEVVAYERE
ncbi:hypothetical protein VTK56DRAFT_7953 [Thermocarpiscus australiensis]